ncbi:fibrocystin-like protein [Pycnococcus provasolii]
MPAVYVGPHACRVVQHLSTPEQIVCDVPPRDTTDGLKYDQYLEVTVAPVSGSGQKDASTCCVRTRHAPSLQRLYPRAGPPGSTPSLVGSRHNAFPDSANAIAAMSVGGASCAVSDETNDGLVGVVGNERHLRCSLPLSFVPATAAANVSLVSTGYAGAVRTKSLQRYTATGSSLMFTYHPEVHAVTPTSGGTGTRVTVSGRGFVQGATKVVLHNDIAPCRVESVSDSELVCVVGPFRANRQSQALRRAQLNQTTYRDEAATPVANPAPVGGRGVLYEWWEGRTKGSSVWSAEAGSLKRFVSAGRPVVRGNAEYASGNATYGWQVLTDEFAAPPMVGCAGAQISGLGQTMTYCYSRFVTFLSPPASGNYTFYATADDRVHLYLAELGEAGAEALPHGELILDMRGAVGYMQLGKRADQISKPVTLQAGKRYMLEAFHAQYAGNSGFAIGARIPSAKAHVDSLSEVAKMKLFTRRRGRVYECERQEDGGDKEQEQESCFSVEQDGMTTTEQGKRDACMRWNDSGSKIASALSSLVLGDTSIKQKGTPRFTWTDLTEHRSFAVTLPWFDEDVPPEEVLSKTVTTMASQNGTVATCTLASIGDPKDVMGEVSVTWGNSDGSRVATWAWNASADDVLKAIGDAAGVASVQKPDESSVEQQGFNFAVTMWSLTFDPMRVKVDSDHAAGDVPPLSATFNVAGNAPPATTPFVEYEEVTRGSFDRLLHPIPADWLTSPVPQTSRAYPDIAEIVTPPGLSTDEMDGSIVRRMAEALSVDEDVDANLFNEPPLLVESCYDDGCQASSCVSDVGCTFRFSAADSDSPETPPTSPAARSVVVAPSSAAAGSNVLLSLRLNDVPGAGSDDATKHQELYVAVYDAAKQGTASPNEEMPCRLVAIDTPRLHALCLITAPTATGAYNLEVFRTDPSNGEIESFGVATWAVTDGESNFRGAAHVQSESGPHIGSAAGYVSTNFVVHHPEIAASEVYISDAYLVPESYLETAPLPSVVSVTPTGGGDEDWSGIGFLSAWASHTLAKLTPDLQLRRCVGNTRVQDDESPPLPTSTRMQCTLPPLSKGAMYALVVPYPVSSNDVSDFGSGALVVRSFAIGPNVFDIDSVSPSMGSIAGGTDITITGSGLYSADSVAVVYVRVPVSTTFPNGLVPCDVSTWEATRIVCRTRAHYAANAAPDDPWARKVEAISTKAMVVRVILCSNARLRGRQGWTDLEKLHCWGDADTREATCSAEQSSCSFQYGENTTPRVTSVTPAKVDAGASDVVFTFRGSGLDQMNAGAFQATLTLLGRTTITCSGNTLDASGTVASCTLATSLSTGSYTIALEATDGTGHAVMQPSESTTPSIVIEAAPVIKSVAPNFPAAGGLIGGTKLVVTGTGFDPQDTTMFVGNNPCASTLVVGEAVECTTPRAIGTIVLEYWKVASSFNLLLRHDDEAGSSPFPLYGAPDYAVDYVETMDLLTESQGATSNKFKIHWATKAAYQGGPNDHWVARTKFQLRFPVAGNFSLWGEGDDSIIVYWSDVLASKAKCCGENGVEYKRGGVLVSAGTVVDVVVTMREKSGNAWLALLVQDHTNSSTAWNKGNPRTLPLHWVHSTPTRQPQSLTLISNDVTATSSISVPTFAYDAGYVDGDYAELPQDADSSSLQVSDSNTLVIPLLGAFARAAAEVGASANVELGGKFLGGGWHASVRESGTILDCTTSLPSKDNSTDYSSADALVKCSDVKLKYDSSYDFSVTLPDSVGRVWGEGEFKQPLKLTRVEPEAGSVHGGTLLTIHGNGFGESDGRYVEEAPHHIRVGGRVCPTLSWTSNTITCRVPYRAETNRNDAWISFHNGGGKQLGRLSKRYAYRENFTPVVASYSPTQAAAGSQEGRASIPVSVEMQIPASATSQIAATVLWVPSKNMSSLASLNNARTAIVNSVPAGIACAGVQLARVESDNATETADADEAFITWSLSCSVDAQPEGGGLPAGTFQLVVLVEAYGYASVAAEQPAPLVNIPFQPVGVHPVAGSAQGGTRLTLFGLGFGAASPLIQPGLSSQPPHTAHHAAFVGGKFCKTVEFLTVNAGDIPASVQHSLYTGQGFRIEAMVCSSASFCNNSIVDSTESCEHGAKVVTYQNSWTEVEEISFTEKGLGSYETTADLTPSVLAISPQAGSTEGGTKVTLKGRRLMPACTPPAEGARSPCSVFFLSPITGKTVGSCNDLVLQSDTLATCVTSTPSAGVSGVTSKDGSGVYGIVKITLPGQIPVLGSIDAESIQDPSDRPDIYEWANLWSRRTTWGGAEPPLYGDSVSIPKNTTVVLDVTPPPLGFLAIEGTLRVLDVGEGAKLALTASHIIVNDGALLAGSRGRPYLGNFEITLTGRREDTTAFLPVYGAKVLAIRGGRLDLYGRPVVRTWTRLFNTAAPGDSCIRVSDDVATSTGDVGVWETGMEIAIGSSVPSVTYGMERRVIERVSANGDGTSELCFASTESLKYRHGGDVVTHVVDDTMSREGNFNRVKIPNTVDDRVPVALLSRNIRIQGDASSKEEKFGVHIMVHKGKNPSAYPRADVHLSHVEISKSGQAGLLGRYSLHFHVERFVNGTVGVADPEEYGHPIVEGCSFHDTFSRAVAIHQTHGVKLINNVAVDIMGHAYFLEDGSEIDNVFVRNLAMGVRAQHRLLWSDTTPAGFWITNPNNTFLSNIAYNTEAYGFWIDLNSAAPFNGRFSPCPTRTRLGVFDGNTANANVKYGVRIHPEWFPSDSCSSKSKLVPTVLSNFTGVKNGMEGAIATQVGSVGFHRFVLSDNGFGGSRSASKVNGKDNGGNVEITWVSDGRPLNAALSQHDPRDYTGLFDSLVVASTIGFWERDQDSTSKPAMFNWPSARKHAGITTQTRSSLLFLDNVAFKNYGASSHPGNGKLAVYEACGKCKANQGGFLSHLSAIQYISPSSTEDGLQLHGGFAWKHQGTFVDRDGTALGKGNNAAMLAHNDLLPASACIKAPAGMKKDGSICTGAVSHRRVALNGHGPHSIKYYPLRFTKFTGGAAPSPVSDSVPFSKYNDNGYQMNVPAGVVYNVDWVTPARVDSNKWTIHGMDAMFEADWVVLRSEQQRRYDHFQVKSGGKVVQKASPSLQAALLRAYTRSIGGEDGIVGLTDAPNGAHTYVEEEGVVGVNASDIIPYTALSLLQLGSSRSNVNIEAKECPAAGCPPPPPPPFIPGNGTVMWTDPSLWPSGTLPQDGEDAYIGPGWDVILNVDTPKLNTLTIAGNLTFLSRGMDDVVTLSANRVVVDRGGRLEAGTDEQPFEGLARISLHGTRASRGVDDAKGDEPAEIRDAASPASKALSVFGALSLVAKTITGAPRYLKLVAQTSTHVDVQGAGANLRISDDFVGRIWLAPSAFNPRSHELVQVTAVEKLSEDRYRLYTDSAPRFSRPEASAPAVGTTVSYEPEVAFVDSSITVTADDGDMQLSSSTERFGCHVASFGNNARVRLHGVTLDHCGQQGLQRPALSLSEGSSAAYNISDVAVLNAMDGGILLRGTQGARLANVAAVLSLDWSTVEVTNSRGGNLIEHVLAGGLEKFKKSKFDKDLPAIFQISELAGGDIVRHTIAAGSDRLGYRYAGADVCDPLVGDGGIFENNVAHAVLVGMMLDGRKGSACSRVAHFTVHHAWDFGLLGMGITANAVLSNSAFFDTKHAGVHMMRQGSFTDENAAVLMHDVHFGGDTASNRGGRGVCSCASGGYKDEGCLFPNPSMQSYPLRSKKIVGLMASAFALGFSPGPEKKPWDKVMNYPIVHGYTHVNVSSFHDFDQCDGISLFPISYHLATTPDAAHPVHLHSASLVNTTTDAGSLVEFPAAEAGWRNPSDCGEDVWEPTGHPLNCNGPGHGLIIDHDGGLFGNSAPMQLGHNVLPRPRVHQGTALDDLYDTSICAPLASGQGHGCKDIRASGGAVALSASPPTPLVFESRDADREERSNGVLQLHTWDSSKIGNNEAITYGPTDLLVATMDHGWCAAYTCQKRLAAFWSVVQMDRDYKANWTGTPPGFLRIWTPAPSFVRERREADSSILLTIPYRDKLRRFAFLPGRGRVVESDQMPSRASGSREVQFFFDGLTAQATILLPSGVGPVEIRTEAVVKLNMKLALSVEQFYDTESGRFASNLAAVLGIDPKRVRVVSIVAGRRRRTLFSVTEGVSVNVEIREDDSVLLAEKDEQSFAVETAAPSPPPPPSPLGSPTRLSPPPSMPPPSPPPAPSQSASLEALATLVVDKATTGELGSALGTDLLSLDVEIVEPKGITDDENKDDSKFSFVLTTTTTSASAASSVDEATTIVVIVCASSALLIFSAAAYYAWNRSRKVGARGSDVVVDVEKATDTTVTMSGAAMPKNTNFESRQDLASWQNAVMPGRHEGDAAPHAVTVHASMASVSANLPTPGGKFHAPSPPSSGGDEMSTAMMTHPTVPSVARASAGGGFYYETENPAALSSTRATRSGSVDQPTTPSAVLFDSTPFGPERPFNPGNAGSFVWRQEEQQFGGAGGAVLPAYQQPRGVGRPAAPAAYATGGAQLAYKRVNPLAVGDSGGMVAAKLPPPPVVASNATSSQGPSGALGAFQRAAKNEINLSRFKSAALPRPPPGIAPPSGPPPPHLPSAEQQQPSTTDIASAIELPGTAAGDAGSGASLARQTTDERVEDAVRQAKADLAVVEAAETASVASKSRPTSQGLDRQRSALSEFVQDQLGVDAPPDDGRIYAGVISSSPGTGEETGKK